MPDQGLLLEIGSLSLFVDGFIDPVESIRKPEQSGDNTRAASGNVAVLGGVRKCSWGPMSAMLSPTQASTFWAIWEEYEYRRLTSQDLRLVVSDTITLVRDRGSRKRALAAGTTETLYNSGANREYYAKFYAVFAGAPETVDYAQSNGIVEIISFTLQEAGENVAP